MYSICLLLPLAIIPKIICRTQFVHLHISEPTPVEPFACHIPPLKFAKYSLCFSPAVSGPRKRKRQGTAADPDSETTSPSDSDTSSTVNTSTSEGEDEKDFILPDYPSDQLTSSESSDSEPEEAPPRISARAGQSKSPGSTHSSTETTSAPKISQTTSTTRAPHFPSSSCSSTPISGGCCAAKQTCEPSRSSSPSPLHTTPRILSPSLSPS